MEITKDRINLKNDYETFIFKFEFRIGFGIKFGLGFGFG